MPVSIRVNGLSLVHRGSGGISSATLPDVCATPLTQAAVPFSNTALSRDLQGGSRSVAFDGGEPAAIDGSRLSPSRGDEPGSLGGVVSGVHRGAATFLTHSFDVRVEGRGVCRLTDKMLHNQGNTVNCSGIAQAQVAGHDHAAGERARPASEKGVLVVEVVTHAADRSEQPVPHAHVHVSGKGQARHQRTDRKGKARFELPVGSYDIEVRHHGFDREDARGHAARPQGTRKVKLRASSELEEPHIPAYGIHNPLRGPAENTTSELTTAVNHHMRYMRINVVNDQKDDPTKQAERVTGYVDAIKLLRSHGVLALPTLMHVDGEGALRGPAKADAVGRAHWKSFCTQLCSQLKPGGSAGFGDKDPYAIRCWEIWNEPNLAMFWPGPDPRRYLVTLRDARAALRDADPHARIVLGGLSQIHKDYDPIKFLREVVKRGGKKLFDAVGIHPYGNKPARAISIVGSVQRELKRLKLTGKDPKTDVQIWITEIGWAVPNAPWAGTELTAKDQEDQAFRIRRLARFIELQREGWRLGPTFWYCYYDYDPTVADANTWAANCGIFDAHQRTIDGDTISYVTAGARAAAVEVSKRATSKGKLRHVPLPPLRR